MYILGDIGNSETKIYLVNSKNKIIKDINFSSKQINNKILNRKFMSLVKNFKSIKKVLFCSVVPKSFNLIKNFLLKIIFLENKKPAINAEKINPIKYPPVGPIK